MTLRLPSADGGFRTYVPRSEPAAFLMDTAASAPASTAASGSASTAASAPAGTAASGSVVGSASGSASGSTAGPPLASRTVFSAAHVVADPYADVSPDGPAAVDWDATLAFRRHLWSHGLGVAEAMDTAQRGMGLDWAGAAELIRRSAAEAEAVGGRIACGVGTDQLAPGPHDLGTVRAAYEEQLALVEETGSQAILMASRALAAAAKTPDDYLDVYAHLLRQAAEPVVLHWLGPMFDPALEGYWGSTDLDAATETFLQVISDHPDKVDGIKISLLDARREVELRRRLPDGVRCYTGDDFNYPELIAGDERGFSHALLGIFDPLGPLAAQAVRLLDTGDVAGFRDLLDPTVELSRHLFQAPTRFYKTGVVLLAWLAGHQDHFAMVGGLQSARSLPHLARAYELADGLGLFPDPVAAEARMASLLRVYGVDH
ncbi:dihydrodipicolinate synthase family protein [Streptomyces sp. NRRL F-5135]|uniref:dihydrodipicolinate synthase family protein n=1 Tax=Streptomyces sp. NRRL F-5135 TaxID=1463858 RepID=UPI000AC2CFF5|nr:dihydrodipicolinate synthase family protein [Streptomyces sp. NRRL F-5135]